MSTNAQGQGPSPDDLADAANRTAVYSLSVVRLADPNHAKLALVNITDSSQQVYPVCASPSSGLDTFDSSDASDSDPANSAQSDSADSGSGASVASHMSSCAANTILAVNVSAQSKWVSLQPELMFPDVEGVRVEVNGQVLSRGGDVGADMIADTSGRSNTTTSRYLTAKWNGC